MAKKAKGKNAKKGKIKGSAAPAQEKDRSRPEYISPSYLEIKCPRCGGPNTRPTGTKGPIQYRVCKSATCRESFKIARRRVLAD